jgi:hypothetical protein
LAILVHVSLVHYWNRHGLTEAEMVEIAEQLCRNSIYSIYIAGCLTTQRGDAIFLVSKNIPAFM